MVSICIHTASSVSYLFEEKIFNMCFVFVIRILFLQGVHCPVSSLLTVYVSPIALPRLDYINMSVIHQGKLFPQPPSLLIPEVFEVSSTEDTNNNNN